MLQRCKVQRYLHYEGVDGGQIPWKTVFQGKLSRIYFYMEKNPHFRDSRYITILADI